ncbi:MFS transporter [Amycolatopsis sp. GM8]|uniref:MFS transporter n=1 Tax=Amycolatopsis sp. GM8 TaxID=2896530 RepID=UPI001F02D88E|nr:MFS transporter [Amycolatopsis sp. GM8]
MSESSAAIALPRPLSARRRLPHAVSFAAVAAIAVLFLAASSAPSPLYIVYQQNWHFSAETLTAVFAVYVLGLIASLLVLGALSDHIGRRPVLASAIALEALSLVLFLVAGDVSVLFIARLVQGIATGAAITTLSATLVDLDPPHAPGRAGVVNGIAPTTGLALGALGCGALVQFAPAPTHLVFALLLAGMVLAAVIVAVMPETSARRPGGMRSLVPRLGVPARLRPGFFALVPIMIAGWSLGGLYLSLGPSVAAGLFGLTNHFIGGLVVTLLCATGAVTTFGLRKRPAAQVLWAGTVLLAAGIAITLVAMSGGSVPVGIAGTIVAGMGFGASALATFGTLARLSAPAERGELFAVAYVVSYLAFSVPAVVAGFAATAFGLKPTAIVYASVLLVLAAAAVVVELVRTRRAAA